MEEYFVIFCSVYNEKAWETSNFKISSTILTFSPSLSGLDQQTVVFEPNLAYDLFLYSLWAKNIFHIF